MTNQKHLNLLERFFYSKVEIHDRTHTEKNPFACQTSDKKISKKGSLVVHQATHSDVISFRCSICPEGGFLKTKSHLINLMVYHYETKFACSHFEYKTHRKCNLDLNLKTHDKKK